jgi:hypothetical protein
LRTSLSGHIDPSHDDDSGKTMAAPLASLLALGLDACGGGGRGNGNDGGDDGSPSPGALTGVFVDAPVSGLAYTCGDDVGVTTAAGQFRYDAGDTCTFSAGALSRRQVLHRLHRRHAARVGPGAGRPAAGAPSGCGDYFAIAIEGDAATVTTLDAEPVTLGLTRIRKPFFFCARSLVRTQPDARASSAATAGSCLPSRNSRKAPPAVEM